MIEIKSGDGINIHKTNYQLYSNSGISHQVDQYYIEINSYFKERIKTAETLIQTLEGKINVLERKLKEVGDLEKNPAAKNLLEQLAVLIALGDPKDD